MQLVRMKRDQHQSHVWIRRSLGSGWSTRISSKVVNQRERGGISSEHLQQIYILLYGTFGETTVCVAWPMAS